MDQITDPGDLRRYRTELPNLIDDLDLDPYAFRLYVRLKRVAGDRGQCWQSTRTLAAACKMSVGQVVNAKRALLVAELIRIYPAGQALADGTIRKSDTIEIADVWAENMRTYAADAVDNSGDNPGDRSHSERDRSPHERDRSPHERDRSPREPKNKPYKKQQIKNKPGKKQQQPIENFAGAGAVVVGPDLALALDQVGIYGDLRHKVIAARPDLSPADALALAEYGRRAQAAGRPIGAPVLANMAIRHESPPPDCYAAQAAGGLDLQIIR